MNINETYYNFTNDLDIIENGVDNQQRIQKIYTILKC